MHYPRLAIVDLETTGADPTRDRITEIAILITEGDTLLEQWSTLVNPGVPIPYRIQELIGITDEMVADAPGFAELADAVRQRLDGAVFVAHNVRFDYNFLRAAFEREGQAFHQPALCSVKFSRALYPQFARHGLDAIIERHGYTIASRHRALDDAQVVWQFLQDSRAAHDATQTERAWQRALSTTPQTRLPAGELEALPEAPGVYVLRNAQGYPLEIGRARNLRSEVLGIFTNKDNPRLRSRAKGVAAVDTLPAAGDLDTGLLELQVLQNEASNKRQQAAWGWQLDSAAASDTPIMSVRDLQGSDPKDWHDIFGCLRGPIEAQKLLRDISAKHQLCPRRLGLERGKGACHSSALGKCRGVCKGLESPAEHDKRLRDALHSLRLREWPTGGVAIVHEFHAEAAREVFHVFDRWCYLGSREQRGDAMALASEVPRRFDAEVYRLLQRWLAQPGALERLAPLHTG
ncbi:exonuclease domain-containing protein [Viridibacterium curvum]|uniref:DNA-directed DNA polymerase n=1 Tax=Viridibacterium curvum TaxID=1101404 RepID=A0ABP9QLX2_9RHOO